MNGLKQLARMVNAVVRATIPSDNLTIQDRRRIVAAQICELVQADIWLWFSGEVNMETPGDSMVISFVDGGFRDDRERAEFFRIVMHPELTPTVNAPISHALASQRSFTGCRSQLIGDNQWRQLPVATHWQELGFDDFIISAMPVGSTQYSALGFHRRWGRERFTQSDVDLVESISESLGWMHHLVTSVEASQHVLSLSPRERQVVVLLIEGDSRKDVATKLGLSEHTVGDYVKEIYRKFSVNSRAELLAKFIQGQT